MKLFNKNELFLLEEIVKKNFSAKYKDSVLGVLWTVLSPLLLMSLFTIVFSTLFKRSIDNFPVYFLSGWCIFQFFSSSVNVSMSALKRNKNILKRTATPKYIFVFAGIINELINFLIMLVLLICILLVTHAPIYWSTIPFALIPIMSLLIMITGISFAFSIICVYYADVQHLWSVISMMLMYACAIFYPMDRVPEPYYDYFILNPLYWVIDQFRCFVYLGTFPEIGYMINSILLSLILLVFGVIIFKKYENKITMKF